LTRFEVLAASRIVNLYFCGKPVCCGIASLGSWAGASPGLRRAQHNTLLTTETNEPENIASTSFQARPTIRLSIRIRSLLSVQEHYTSSFTTLGYFYLK
jgi:hypothetical protein